MSRFAEDAAVRIVRSLSALLDKRITTIVDPPPADDDHVLLLTPNMAVRGEVPWTDAERDLVREVTGIVRYAGERDALVRDLDLRLAAAQRENLELMVRNRVLSEISARDSLTGLYNRWYVMEKIDSEMNRSMRHGSPVSLLMMDIDHFKRVNDSFGHTAGDHVLKCVGQVLRDSCRVYDVPGRYGGEEFCVVLPETKVGNTSVVAERIRQRLATSRFEVGDASVGVTASIGIAGMDSGAGEVLSPSALIDRADRALYSAKHLGRNRIELWDVAMRSADAGH